jgi:transposase
VADSATNMGADPGGIMWRSLVCDDWTRSKNSCEADRSTCMPRTPDELLNDIAELKALLLAKDTELAAKDAELVTAKNGLIHSRLTVETLKAQLAKLRREKFGQSSERIKRVLEQLELALEEAEAAPAESTATAPHLRLAMLFETTWELRP